jgi:nucleotide-binding universal stress UspA family protein
MIRKILAPTDFSPNAAKALDYAIYIANETGAELYVLNTYEVPTATGHFVPMEGLVREDRLEELNDLLAALRPKMRNEDKLKGLLKEGSSVSAICYQADEIKADLIIMGTQGASGLKKILVGSTTANVLQNTKIPVLAVPYEVGGYALQNITIALDANKLPDPFVLNPAIGLGRQFKSVFNLVHMVADGQSVNDSTIDENVQDHFKQFDIPYTYFKVQTNDVEGGLLDFARRKNTNLLCVITHQKSWFSRLVFGSVSKQLAMDSTIPLLVLHD